MLSALYYDRGYLSVQIGTPRVMLTPDRKGIEIAITIDEGPRFKIRQLRIYERDADGHEVEPLGGRRALRADGPRRVRATTSTARSSSRTCRRSGRCTATPATPTSRPSPRRSSTPFTSEVDIVVPIKRGPSSLRAHRDQGQHEDARQGDPPRDGDRRGRALQRDQARTQQAPHHGARLFRARRRLHRAGLGARQNDHQHRGQREADRHFPGRRGLLSASRTSSRRRRCSRRTSSATVSRSRCRRRSRPPPARHAALLRAVFPRQRLELERRALRSAPRLPRLRPAHRRRLAHLRLPAHPAVLRLSVTATTE